MYVAPLAIRFPLLDPDEGLHAAIAQEMVERGDYVTPRLQGAAFLDKPILYFWLQAGSLRLFGFNEAAVRLPGVVCGLLGALTTGLLARRIWGGIAFPLATLVQLSMVAPAAIAQAAVHDVALVPLLNLAMCSWWNASEESRQAAAAGWYAAGGVFLGLAILTKGLVGPALVGLGFVVYVVAARRVTWTAVLGVAGASLLALLVAAPWYWRMSVANPGYLHYFFVERHVQGFATGTQRHGGRPWWYYLPILIGGTLPWTLDLASLALRRISSAWRSPASALSRPWLAIGGWLAADLVFLSVASSKLWTYCLPLFPALSLIVVVLWREQLQAERRPESAAGEPRWYRISVLAISTFVAAAALPFAMLVTSKRFGVQFSTVLWVAGIGIALTLPVWRFCWYFGRHRWALVTMQMSLAAHALTILWLIMPHVAENSSARGLAEYFNEQDKAPGDLIVVDERQGTVVFYLRPELRRQLRTRQIRTVLREHLAADPNLARGATVVISNRTFPKLVADSPYRTRAYEQVGRFRLYRTD